MINNNRASIFIFILILVNIILILGYVVFNNVTVMNNNIDIGKNAEEVFQNVQQKGDINIKTALRYNGNGFGFEDFISCPTNVTMSGTSLKTTGITTQMHYSLGSYFCVGDYYGNEFRIFFDKDTNDFNRGFYDGSVIDISKDTPSSKGVNLAQGKNLTASTRINSNYDKSYANDGSISGKFYANKRVWNKKAYIKIDLGGGYDLHSLEVDKYDRGNDTKFWDTASIRFYNTSDNKIGSDATFESGIRGETNLIKNIKNLSLTEPVRYIRIKGKVNNQYLDIREIKIFKSETPVGTGERNGQTNFNTDDTFISFDDTGVSGGDLYDDNFNSDDYVVTSTGGIYYPGGYQDDDVIPRLTIFGDVKKSDIYQNIYWSNYKTNEFIDKNTNNDDLLNVKMGDVEEGHFYIDLFSLSENIQFDIKIYEFDRNAYENKFTLLLNKSFEGKDIIDNSGFIEFDGTDVSLSTAVTANTMSFDFKNNDYAIFLINKLESNLSYRLVGKTLTGKGIYINPIDDSSESIIESLSNHMIIGDEKNFIGEQFIIVGSK